MIRPLSINERLHLVIPIYADDGETITGYVHSAPISREVFEAHFMLISKTFSMIYSEGLAVLAGPRIASLVLRRAAEAMGNQAGGMALMNEIRRLSNVLLRSSNGWDAHQFQEAVDHQLLSEDDLTEVTNAIVYFIVASAMHPKRQLRIVMDGVTQAWGAQTLSSNFTTFAASLPTSSGAVSTTPNPNLASAVVF